MLGRSACGLISWCCERGQRIVCSVDGDRQLAASSFCASHHHWQSTDSSQPLSHIKYSQQADPSKGSPAVACEDIDTLAPAGSSPPTNAHHRQHSPPDIGTQRWTPPDGLVWELVLSSYSCCCSSSSPSQYRSGKRPGTPPREQRLSKSSWRNRI